MKTTNRENKSFGLTRIVLTRALVVAGFLLCVGNAQAQMLPGTNYGPTYVALDSWSFNDFTNWTSDKGCLPLSFTNLDHSYLGDFSSLIVDSTNPAYLQFNIVETNSPTTNLTVDAGTVLFWFGPSWSSSGLGGAGPGEYGRLLDVGGYTADSSFGWWSIYVDSAGDNLYFSAQTNDLSSNVTTYLFNSISWSTNYFHFVAITYSSTNTALYLDGALASTGPPMTVYPGPDALANGFFIGSDSNGVFQAHGMFCSLATYNVPLDADTIAGIYDYQHDWIMMNPLNMAMSQIASAPSSPSFTPVFNAITGQGNLLYVTNLANCVNGSTAYTVWLTNITASVAGNGTMNVSFSISGGADFVPFDVFANSILSFGTNGVPWAWMGQGYHCNTYMLTNLPNTACFLILGTPQSTSGSGLTDAYESLAAKVDPNGPQSDSYGVPYAWYAENGLVPITNGLAIQDPDKDALLNYQEYQYGTKPNVSEGFSIWIGAVNGTTVIP